MADARNARPEGRTVAEMAALVGATVEAPAGFDATATIDSLESVDRAGPRSLTFVGSGKYAKLLDASPALAAVVSVGIELSEAARNRAILRVKSADLAMITILELFADPEILPEVGIDPTAPSDRLVRVPRSARAPRCSKASASTPTRRSDKTVSSTPMSWCGSVARWETA